jgi:hypothetical protein
MISNYTVLIISPLTVLCFLTLASLIKTMKQGMHRLWKFCEDEHLEVKNIPIGTVQQDVMGSHVILIDRYPFTYIPRGVRFKFMPPPSCNIKDAIQWEFIKKCPFSCQMDLLLQILDIDIITIREITKEKQRKVLTINFIFSHSSAFVHTFLHLSCQQ